MSRHLKSCLNKNDDKIIEGDQSQKSLYYHIYVKGTYRSDYWLQLQVKEDTKLDMNVVNVFKTEERKDKITVLARNNQPEIKCSQCDNPAEFICPQCKYTSWGWYCSDCLDKHEENDCMMNEFEFLPVVNSPRVGVCAYSGN